MRRWWGPSAPVIGLLLLAAWPAGASISRGSHLGLLPSFHFPLAAPSTGSASAPVLRVSLPSAPPARLPPLPALLPPLPADVSPISNLAPPEGAKRDGLVLDRRDPWDTSRELWVGLGEVDGMAAPRDRTLSNRVTLDTRDPWNQAQTVSVSVRGQQPLLDHSDPWASQ